MNDEYLFDSAHSALLFAFNFAHQAGAQSQMSGLLKKASGSISGKGLVGLDGAAQAGFIRREVSELRPFERNLIVARFSMDKKENLTAKMALVEPAMMSLGTGVHQRRMVDQLVQRHFGARILLNALADKFGMHQNTMTTRWRSVHGALKKGEIRAYELIETALKSRGVIE